MPGWPQENPIEKWLNQSWFSWKEKGQKNLLNKKLMFLKKSGEQYHWQVVLEPGFSEHMAGGARDFANICLTMSNLFGNKQRFHKETKVVEHD